MREHMEAQWRAVETIAAQYPGQQYVQDYQTHAEAMAAAQQIYDQMVKELSEAFVWMHLLGIKEAK